MLNEGYALAKSLDKMGIRPHSRHRDVKEVGKGEGIVVGLNHHGEVQSIEYRNQMAELWTIREGKHNSFPVLKLQRPLLKIGKDSVLRRKLKEEHHANKKCNLIFAESTSVNITPHEQSWWKRLRERVEYLIQFFDDSRKGSEALKELMKRFLSTDSYEQFSGGLLRQLKRQQNHVPYPLLEKLLIGDKWDAKKKEYRAEVYVALDVSDWEKYDIRVASPKMETIASMCLRKSELAKQRNDSDPPSALSGERVAIEKEKFPDPKLPIIGNAFLFAVNKNTPCQTRYNRISTQAIPVGRDEAIAIQDSLTWITKPERKGNTWYPVPSITDGVSDLLIVYLENKPESQSKAYMLGGFSKDHFSESTYESVAKAAIKALQGEEVVRPSDLIRLFALHKADKGRTQVSLERVYTIADLVRADKDWRQAASNAPNISMPFFRKEVERITAKREDITARISQLLAEKKSMITFFDPRCPFPADLVKVTQRQWNRLGENSVACSGCTLGDIYDIFFANAGEQRTLVENLLSLTLQRTQPLLVGVGHALTKSRSGFWKPIQDLSADKRFTVLTTISSIVIYLYKLGIRKENYMKDTFFYVGRFLSLVDTLHFEYCKHVRGGFPDAPEDKWRKAIPPQLLGNAHLNIALDSPASAFDLLSRRLNVYEAWTKKEQSNTVGLARWCMGEIRKVTALLAEKPDTLPTRTASVDRAQILLGYLAKSDEAEKADNN